MTKIYVCTMCYRLCMAIIEDSASTPNKCLYSSHDRVNWHLIDIDRYAYDKPIHPYEEVIKRSGLQDLKTSRKQEVKHE